MLKQRDTTFPAATNYFPSAAVAVALFGLKNSTSKTTSDKACEFVDFFVFELSGVKK